MILKFSCDDAKKMTDIIVSYSIIDDFLCGYIVEYNNLTNGKNFADETKKIRDNRASLGMGDKIDCFYKVFPNHEDSDGHRVKEAKSSLCNLKEIRKQVAHDRRFSFEDGKIIEGRYPANAIPLSNLHQQYERNFNALRPILNIFYSDWEYREYYLYDIKGADYYV